MSHLGQAKTNEDESRRTNDKDVHVTVEEIYTYYRIDKLKIKAKNTNHGFEEFHDETFESHSLSNAFKTSKDRLGHWIFALQNHVYIDLASNGFDVRWNNKTDNKNNIVEIEIHLTEKSRQDTPEKKSLAIHVFLTTALIQIKGSMIHKFIKEIFPELKALMPNKTSVDITLLNQQKHQEEKCNKEESTTPNMLHDIEETLGVLKKINLTEYFHNLQESNEALISKFSKMEERYANLEKKLVSKFELHKEEMSMIVNQKDEEHDLSTLNELRNAISSLSAQNDLLMGEVDEKNRSIAKLAADNKHLVAVIKEKEEIIYRTMQKHEASKESNEQVIKLELVIKGLEKRLDLLATRNESLEELNKSLKDHLETTRSFLSGRSSHRESSPDPEQLTGKPQKANDVILLGDSMFKGLKADWLLKNEGRVTKIKFAPTLQEAKQELQSIAEANCIMLHCGTNDAKSTAIDEMVKLTKECVDTACQKAEKVVLSTIIPRYDDSSLRLKIQLFNARIAEMYFNDDKVVICDNSILTVREDQVGRYFDINDKVHLSKDGNSTFASNIKISICKAMNLTVINRIRQNSPDAPRRSRPRRNLQYERR